VLQTRTSVHELALVSVSDRKLAAAAKSSGCAMPATLVWGAVNEVPNLIHDDYLQRRLTVTHRNLVTRKLDMA
jgi:hypothetical protein